MFQGTVFPDSCMDVVASITPFPDETVGSLAARYHIWSCNSTIRKTKGQLFGATGVVPNSDLPCNLRRFVDRIGGAFSGETLDDFIHAHTAIPYYCFFGTQQQEVRIKECMAASGSPKAVLGLLASTFGAISVLKFCPLCHSLDMEKFGIAYWHRCHQLPEVSACSSHGIPLIQFWTSADLLERHTLPLPPQHFNGSGISTTLESSHLGLQFASSSAELLALSDARFSPNDIRRAYCRRLIESGFATRRNTVDIRLLVEGMLKHYGSFSFLPHADKLFGTRDCIGPWLERLLRKPRGRQHPVLHLLLTNFAFEGPQDLLHTISAHQMADECSPETTLETKLRNYLTVNSITLSETAKNLRMSLDTVRVAAKSFGIKVPTRPKYIVPELEQTVLRLLTSGSTIVAIAAALHISKTSVYRILRSNSEVRSLLQVRKLTARRELRRSTFLEHWLARNQYSVVHEMPNYSWLARYDRNWLTETLSHGAKRTKLSKQRVDWGARDLQLLIALNSAHQSILSSEARVRVTVNELGRRVKKIGLLQKFKHKLPLSSSLLSKIVETPEQYAALRDRQEV